MEPEAIMAGRETPFFFASHGRPLYGVFHAPAVQRPGAPVLVHCHSLGAEHMVCYRTEVLAARAAAASGIPVLRFHARGHGDSAGDDASITFDGLVDDAIVAAHEALRLAGSSAVAWLGIRFGALVAAAAATRFERTSALALWEPVFDPAVYFRGMLRGLLLSQVAKGLRPQASVDELLALVVRDGPVDVNGYLLHPAILESSRDRRLPELLARWRLPTLLVRVQRQAAVPALQAALVEQLKGNGAFAVQQWVAEEPGWHFMTNPGWQSPDLARATAEWMHGLC